jgi:hypothetical protein
MIHRQSAEIGLDLMKFSYLLTLVSCQRGRITSIKETGCVVLWEMALRVQRMVDVRNEKAREIQTSGMCAKLYFPSTHHGRPLIFWYKFQ